MSTYLPGVTDNGFNPVQFTPNFPYLANALQKATARYETNYNEISNAYSKITNSLLSSPDNVEFRKKFLDQTKNALKTISTQDLSISQNVEQAERLFSPLWEDEDFLNDYTKSKQYQQEISRYEKLRTSDKKEDRDQAWEYGRVYVDLFRQEMALTKRGDGSIKNVQIRPFIPYIDPNAEITKELKNLGYNDGIVQSYTTPGYIHKITNGEGTSELYEDVLNIILKNRPDINDIFKVQGVTQFESSVFNLMSTNPELSKEQAQRSVKEKYAADNIATYNEKLKNYNAQLKGNDKYEGLEKELNTIKESLFNPEKGKLALGILTTDSKEYKDYVQKEKLYSGLQSTINNYNSKISSLQSEDYYNTKGEDYFTELFKDRFIIENAEARGAAFKQEITSDASYVASQKIDSQFEMLNARLEAQERRQQQGFANDRYVDTDGDGNVDAIIGGTGTTGGMLGTALPAGTANPRRQLTQSEQQNVPTVESIYGQQKQPENSYYRTFANNLDSYRNLMITSAANALNQSDLMSEIPNFNKYVNYLNYYASGGKYDPNFLKSEIESAYKALKDKKILGDNITAFTQSPASQLNQLITYASTNTFASQSPEFMSNRIEYEDAAKRYNITSKIDNDFQQQYYKKVPQKEFISVVQSKDKYGNYKPINSQYVIDLAKDVPVYKADTNLPTGLVLSTLDWSYNALKNENLISYNKLPQDIAQAFIDGRLNVEPVNRREYYGDDDETGWITEKHYEYNDGEKIYDLTELVKKIGMPNDVSNKLKQYELDRSKTFQEFVSKRGEDVDTWIFSRQLRYSNNPEDHTRDKATTIATSAIENNRGNLIKGTTTIKPSNWEQLKDNVNEDVLTDVLGELFGNQTVLDTSLSNVYLSYTGTNADKSNVKLEFNLGKLKDNIATLAIKSQDANQKGTESVIRSIIKNGISLDVNKNVFNTFAKDDYMSSVITDKMLSEGIKASEYEKNELYYDYTLNQGANNQLVLTYSMKGYNPVTNLFVDGEKKIEYYDKTFGIDNILRTLREQTFNNANTIKSYFKQKTQQEKLRMQDPAQQAVQQTAQQKSTVKLPGETNDEYISRMKNIGVIR
jgi:hypothetical protein